MNATLLTSSVAILLSTASLASAEPVSLGFERPLTYSTSRVLAVASADPVGESQPLPELAETPKAEKATTIFGLPKNMGPIDRAARAVIGSALLGVGIWGLSSSEHLSDTTSYVLMGVSAIPFATAATGYCPLYQLVGIDGTF